jgi:hypothetical protein
VLQPKECQSYCQALIEGQGEQDKMANMINGIPFQQLRYRVRLLNVKGLPRPETRYVNTLQQVMDWAKAVLPQNPDGEIEVEENVRRHVQTLVLSDTGEVVDKQTCAYDHKIMKETSVLTKCPECGIELKTV